MPHLHHTGLPMASSAIGLLVVVLSLWYARGWRQLHGVDAAAIPGWRVAGFVIGMSLLWGALDSPLVAYQHELLTVHMIQHLLLMTIAPALVLLSEPQLAFWYGLPRGGQVTVARLLRPRVVRRIARTIARPAVCWTVATLTLVGWHVPALFTLGLQSQAWHAFQQLSFLAAGFLFWWPVVRPWPSLSTGPQWSTLLYLFFATLPCDALSGFLVFSDRVAYPAYFSMPRHYAGFSVLQDQQCAAALMWTGVTLVYLVPAAILSTRLLSPRGV
jgi:putative membrane protein